MEGRVVEEERVVGEGRDRRGGLKGRVVGEGMDRRGEGG